MRRAMPWCAAVVLAWGAMSVVAAAPPAQPSAPGANTPPADAPAAPGEPETLLDLLAAGGVMMIPIGLCSLVAFAVAIERSMALRRDRVIPVDFVLGLRRSLSPTGADRQAAIAYCESGRSTIGNIFKAGLRKLEDGTDAIEKAIEDAGAREVGKMKRMLRPLASVATIAPLLGLLGTVYGMIGAFAAASNPEVVDKSHDLARGIYVALVTTAAGLSLAIPVLIVHQVLSGRIDALVDDIDEAAIEFLEFTAEGAPALASLPGEGPDVHPQEATAAQPA